MASFIPLGSYRTIKVMSATQVLDVQYVTCTTVPHGFGFAYAVPLTSWLTGAGEGLLAVIADELEIIASNGQAVASSPVQDVDASGLLVDLVEVVVEYNRTAQGLPSLQGTTQIPVEAFFAQETGIGGFTIPGATFPSQYVADEYTRLATLAAA